MFCPNCGKEYFENQNFCRFCGIKLNENCIDTTEAETIDEPEVTDEQKETETQEEHPPLEAEQNEKSSEEITENTEENKEQEQSDSKQEELNQNIEENSSIAIVNKNEEKNNDTTEEGLLQSIKNSLIIEKDGEKHLTSSAMTLLVVLLLFVIFMANLLWSINDAIQINPSMTNENALMNIPNDNEDGAYTQAPEPKQSEELSEENSEEEEEHEFAEQKETDPPLVPIEEIRQMEQQFPEPEIPMPQDLQEEEEN